MNEEDDDVAFKEYVKDTEFARRLYPEAVEPNVDKSSSAWLAFKEATHPAWVKYVNVLRHKYGIAPIVP